MRERLLALSAKHVSLTLALSVVKCAAKSTRKEGSRILYRLQKLNFFVILCCCCCFLLFLCHFLSHAQTGDCKFFAAFARLPMNCTLASPLAHTLVFKVKFKHNRLSFSLKTVVVHFVIRYIDSFYKRFASVARYVKHLHFV